MSPRAKSRLLGSLLCVACRVALAGPADGQQTQTNHLEFGVFWPPVASSGLGAPGVKPLLRGLVSVRSELLPDSNTVARIRVQLARPPDEAGREFWNSRLAFPEYDWMRHVRVWDKENRWLWPNLPFLLRLHGIERVDRYGGIDPGKGVDNDFAAILLRKYDESGQQEDPATQRRPLVAAEWYPGVLEPGVDKQAIVHTTHSDEFTIHLSGPQGTRSGMAALWLIYADFMGAKLPDAWPKAPEFAGGILGYFELNWDLNAGTRHEIKIQQTAPKRSTGFDWKSWARRTRATQDSKSTAILSDIPVTKADE